MNKNRYKKCIIYKVLIIINLQHNLKREGFEHIASGLSPMFYLVGNVAYHPFV